MTEDVQRTGDATPRPLWLGIVGALLGGMAGYFVFTTLLGRFGLYAMVVPGALIGIGRVSGSTLKSIPLGIACGLAAVVLSILTEWSVALMPEGATFADFLQNLPAKPFRNQASLIAGPVMALWFGIGRVTHGRDAERPQE